jgi:bifunctional N-acetylglucosamine-1-phosphate-uridyltransferase/glucosamine-1-phosphate-acetyltransferase GlmU-like protein
VYIAGNTEIGEDVVIGPNTIIEDSIIKHNVNIGGFCLIKGTEIKGGTTIPPFSKKIK